MKMYLFDENLVFAGEQMIIPTDPLPRGVFVEPPQMVEGQVAQWQGECWVVLPGYPASVRPPLAQVPASVSPRQIRQALNRLPHGAGTLRQAVEAAVAAGDQDLRDWWEFATEFERSNEHVVEMGLTLGKTDVELDDLWRLAVTL